MDVLHCKKNMFYHLTLNWILYYLFGYVNMWFVVYNLTNERPPGIIIMDGFPAFPYRLDLILIVICLFVYFVLITQWCLGEQHVLTEFDICHLFSLHAAHVAPLLTYAKLESDKIFIDFVIIYYYNKYKYVIFVKKKVNRRC